MNRNGAGRQSAEPGRGKLFCRTTLLLVLAVPACANAAMALRGLPLLHRIPAGEIPAAPAHLAIAADAAGVIYVGNAEGVLRFAGGDWELFELPGGSPGRALKQGWDGRIHVGGFDQFGVLQTAPDGSLVYEDLRPRFGLRDAEGNVGDVWAVLETPRGIYFRAERALFYLGRDGVTRQWPLHADVRSFEVLGEALFARVEGVGVCRFEDGRLIPLPGAEQFAQRPLLAVVNHSAGLLLASEDGFYRAAPDGIHPLQTDADAAFARNRPYASLRLPDESLVFGTFEGTLLRFSPELSLLDEVRLGSNTLLAFATDPEAGLWVASEVELARLRLPSPWTVYDQRLGLMGQISDSVLHEDTLWVATTVDVLRAQPADGHGLRFEPQGWTRLEAFDLESTPQGLLIAEREGVLVREPGQDTPRRLAQADAVYQVQRSVHRPDRAWALAEHELLWMGASDGRWTLLTRASLQGMSVRAIEQTGPDEFWFGDLRGAPQRWRIDPETGAVRERRRFGAESGLVLDPDRGSSVFVLDAQLYAVSGARAHVLQEERFVSSDLGPFRGIGRAMELNVIDTAEGSYAWTSRDLLHRAPNQHTWQTLHLDAGQARGYRQVQVDADGMLRVIAWNGLLQFDPVIPAPPPVPLGARLERVSLRPGDGAERLLPVQAEADPILPPRSGLQFHFGLVSMEPGSEFRYRLQGYNPAWSDWSNERELNYRQLGPGEYALELEARTRSGRAALPLRYGFSVKPLWYQTPWAWIAAGIAALLSIIAIAQGFVRFRYRQYVEANRKLERRISERTAELQTANRRLSELATEDSLTGVGNRRALEQALGREWQRCGELGLSLALVMIDVDHFKRFNDLHGHLAGDQALRRIAQTLKQDIHPVRELLARFGGEEFALILPGLHLDEAVTRAEALRRRFEHDAGGLSISLGVAAQVPSTRSEAAELLRRADTALYRAKRRGRNRVEAADE